jgi:predicted nucleic acid-binding protein
VIPTVTLSEAITGRPQDAPVNQLVNRIGTVDTDEATARRAGQLRFGVERSGSRRTPTGIDAIVAAHADAQEAVVFTSDPPDLRRLLVDCPWVRATSPDLPFELSALSWGPCESRSRLLGIWNRR